MKSEQCWFANIMLMPWIFFVCLFFHGRDFFFFFLIPPESFTFMLSGCGEHSAPHRSQSALVCIGPWFIKIVFIFVDTQILQVSLWIHLSALWIPALASYHIRVESLFWHKRSFHLCCRTHFSPNFHHIIAKQTFVLNFHNFFPHSISCKLPPNFGKLTVRMAV